MKDQQNLNCFLKIFYWKFVFLIIAFISSVSIARDDLVRAAVRGDFNKVRILIDNEGLDVNARNRDGYTALMGASTAGHIRIVRFLKRRGARLNLRGPRNVTALILAIYQDHKRVFRFLIRSRACPYLSDDDGVTPLFLLSYKGYLRDIRFLMKYHKLDQLDLNVQTNDDRFSALMAAVDSEHIQVVRFLVDSGADLDLQDKWGVTALMKAVVKGNEKIAHILVDAGANVMKQDGNNFSALDYATLGKEEIMEILLKGIKVNPYCSEALVSEKIH